jgi:hypothetical protein
MRSRRPGQQQAQVDKIDKSTVPTVLVSHA